MKPKILQLIGEFTSGGAETIAIKLTNELMRDGWDVLISARADGPLSKRVSNEECIHIIDKYKTIDFNYLRRLIHHIKVNNVDIIHSHLFGNDLYGFIAGIITGKKIILTIHGMDFKKNWKRVLIYNFMALFVERIVTVSSLLEKEVSKRIITKKRNILTINNGIDINSEIDGKHVEAIRKSLGIVHSYPIIGSVGNVKRVKGYECLIESARYVIKKFSNAKFLIVGECTFETEYKEELDRLIKKYELENVVLFLGFRDDIPTLISLFDIFVLPSRSEGLSIALLEAMSLKRPIIATKVGGNVLVLKDKDTALMIEPGDSHGLTNCIENLIFDRELREKIACSAQIEVKAKYSFRSMYQLYKSLYLSLY